MPRTYDVQFVLALDANPDSFEHYAMYASVGRAGLGVEAYCVRSREHLRMSGVYWALMTMELLGETHRLPLDDIVEFVMKCQYKSGGFGGNVNHDPHLLYTLSAIQILAVLGKLDLLDRELTASYIAALQKPDGSFTGAVSFNVWRNTT